MQILPPPSTQGPGPLGPRALLGRWGSLGALGPLGPLGALGGPGGRPEFQFFFNFFRSPKCPKMVPPGPGGPWGAILGPWARPPRGYLFSSPSPYFPFLEIIPITVGGLSNFHNLAWGKRAALKHNSVIFPVAWALDWH